MRMSMLAYVSLGLAACFTLMAYIVNPDPKVALSMLPMVLVLGAIPWLMNVLDRRHVDSLDLRHVKLSKIKELAKKNIGEQVRIRGTVQSVTNKWLNRPHIKVADDTGAMIGVHMFVVPREEINCGDQIETIGSLRWSFGFSKKEKNIWGLRMERIKSS